MFHSFTTSKVDRGGIIFFLFCDACVNLSIHHIEKFYSQKNLFHKKEKKSKRTLPILSNLLSPEKGPNKEIAKNSGEKDVELRKERRRWKKERERERET